MLGDAAASQGCAKTDTTNQAGRNRKEASLKLQSPTFLAPGTGFVKDNFSTNTGRGQGVGVEQGPLWFGSRKGESFHDESLLL